MSLLIEDEEDGDLPPIRIDEEREGVGALIGEERDLLLIGEGHFLCGNLCTRRKNTNDVASFIRDNDDMKKSRHEAI